MTRSITFAADRTSRDRLRSQLHERDEQQTQPSSPQDGSSFTQRVREKLQIGDGSEEVGRTLEEVEQTLREFYGQPVDSSD